jgi:hypothetical protein
MAASESKSRFRMIKPKSIPCYSRVAYDATLVPHEFVERTSMFVRMTSRTLERYKNKLETLVFFMMAIGTQRCGVSPHKRELPATVIIDGEGRG